MKPTQGQVPVRILAGQGASERAERALREYFAELDDRLGESLGESLGPDPFVLIDVDEVTPPRGDFLLLSELGTGTVLGFGGVHLYGAPVGQPQVAELQRMWLVPDARGRGLGRFLLRALENRARALGAHQMRLSLHHSLTEALALYESAHYAPVDRFDEAPHLDVFLGKEL